jgi:hypothetical protein
MGIQTVHRIATDNVQNQEKEGSLRGSREKSPRCLGFGRSPDTAEYVAQKILEGIEIGEAEIFAHDEKIT